jgi:hypothetical protein
MLKKLIIIGAVLVVLVPWVYEGGEQEQVTTNKIKKSASKDYMHKADALYADRMEKAAKVGVFLEGVDKDQSWFKHSEKHLSMKKKLLSKKITIREYYLFRDSAKKMAMNYTWDNNPLNIKLKDVIYLKNIRELIRNNFVNKKMNLEWLKYWNEDVIRIRTAKEYLNNG